MHLPVQRSTAHRVGSTHPFASCPWDLHSHLYNPPHLQYDSVHGRYEGSVDDSKEGITIDGQTIKVFSQM